MLTLFWFAGALSLLAAVLALTRRDAVHALLWAVASLLGVAAVFVALGAPLVAALEVIVYAGAILVLFVFVVMLLSGGVDRLSGGRSAWIGPSALALALAVALVVARGATPEVEASARVAPREVAHALVGPYLIGVELVSMLLLAGLIGVWQIGRGERPTDTQVGVEEGSGGGSGAAQTRSSAAELSSRPTRDRGGAS